MVQYGSKHESDADIDLKKSKPMVPKNCSSIVVEEFVHFWGVWEYIPQKLKNLVPQAAKILEHLEHLRFLQKKLAEVSHRSHSEGKN